MTFDQERLPESDVQGGGLATDEIALAARYRDSLPKLVSLFSGAGGMDLGFKQAGYSIAVAIDAAPAAVLSYQHNFPRTLAVVGDLTKLKPLGVVREVLRKIVPGSKIGVIGGPPCQGFSRANNAAALDDPRNQLPKLYVKIVKELKKIYDVEFLVIENVPGMTDRKHAPTYSALIQAIDRLGFNLTEQMLCATDHGVAQNRKRIILTGLRKNRQYGPVKILKEPGAITVREAIAGFPEPQYFKRGLDPSSFPLHENHWTMNPLSVRFSEEILRSSVRRSFKRLSWDLPSPTIAFGNREIHVHPEGHRRLSIYEAMRLQGFPPEFVLKGNLSEQVSQVSNAVPPPLAKSIAEAVIRAMECI